MDSYKGIKRGQSKEIFYWLDVYCKNKDPKILENDIVLQDMVKKFHRKQTLKYAIFTIGAWSLMAYAIDYLIKG